MYYWASQSCPTKGSCLFLQHSIPDLEAISRCSRHILFWCFNCNPAAFPSDSHAQSALRPVVLVESARTSIDRLFQGSDWEMETTEAGHSASKLQDSLPCIFSLRGIGHKTSMLLAQGPRTCVQRLCWTTPDTKCLGTVSL